METKAHFYLGISHDCNIVLPNTGQDYELCIFYHRKRFAFQALSGAGEVLINDEEQVAGYLSDGDVLKVAGETFIFRTHS